MANERLAELVQSYPILYDKSLVDFKNAHKNMKTFLLFSCLLGDVLFVWTAVSNMFGACMHMLSQRLVSIDTVSCLCTSLVQCFKLRTKTKKKKKKLMWTFLKMGR